ncbi:uncharacterized protein LOC105426845 [Pogonomyrmex barbatus]|uniref:Uncharacterized protein LOC105426845 n=1 Tax=Pogonomyrmex barbatus TaxID=144034 RepID=A0A6I9WC59_9HYME|nr:uncharacterized protein LOC105426845 [Pogonomyrmex barbatus]
MLNFIITSKFLELARSERRSSIYSFFWITECREYTFQANKYFTRRRFNCAKSGVGAGYREVFPSKRLMESFAIMQSLLNTHMSHLIVMNSYDVGNHELWYNESISQLTQLELSFHGAFIYITGGPIKSIYMLHLVF